MPSAIPAHAKVVIVGGGIAGCSIAYHLAQMGWTDVMLLDKGELTSGTTFQGRHLDLEGLPLIGRQIHGTERIPQRL